MAWHFQWSSSGVRALQLFLNVKLWKECILSATGAVVLLRCGQCNNFWIKGYLRINLNDVLPPCTMKCSGKKNTLIFLGNVQVKLWKNAFFLSNQSSCPAKMCEIIKWDATLCHSETMLSSKSVSDGSDILGGRSGECLELAKKFSSIRDIFIT